MNNQLFIKDDIYENFVQSYTLAKNKLGTSILEMAQICLKANKELSNEQFKKWISDSRINLKMTQIKKLIAIALNANGQLTDFLNKKGLEETYLVTRIKDPEIQSNVVENLQLENFTVNDTKKIIALIQKDKKPIEEAFETVKNNKNLHGNKKITAPKTISINEYYVLQEKYNNLLKIKESLEEEIKKLTSIKQSNQEINQYLTKPVETMLPNNQINYSKRSIAVNGMELPIPIGINIENSNIELIRMAAINNAKNNFNYDTTKSIKQILDMQHKSIK